jgi:BlaI family penicillinase repressor
MLNRRFMPKRTKPLPKISDAEWIVMQAVWQNGTVTANEVVAALENSTDWRPKTIHTLLRRLVDKGALEFDRKGREYLFKPLVSATDCERAATRSFLDRFFGGELAPFLTRFVEHEKLKPSEIEELKRILEGKK